MNGRHITATELDHRLAQTDALISQLSRQLNAHETWHRDMLLRASETGAGRRLAITAVVISALAAVAALITALAPVVG